MLPLSNTLSFTRFKPNPTWNSGRKSGARTNYMRRKRSIGVYAFVVLPSTRTRNFAAAIERSQVLRPYNKRKLKLWQETTSENIGTVTEALSFTRLKPDQTCNQRSKLWGGPSTDIERELLASKCSSIYQRPGRETFLPFSNGLRFFTFLNPNLTFNHDSKLG